MKVVGVKVSETMYDELRMHGSLSDVLREAISLYLRSRPSLKDSLVNHEDTAVNQTISASEHDGEEDV